MPSPTIHTLWKNNCIKQLLPLSSRLAALGELHGAAPSDHITPVDLSRALPLTSLETRTFCNSSSPDQPLLCQWSAICSCRSSKDTLRGPWTLGVISRDPVVGYWLLLQVLKGWNCSSEMAWRQNLERGIPREIPGFVSWKWHQVFFSYYPKTLQLWYLYTEVRQQPRASFEDLKREKSPCRHL